MSALHYGTSLQFAAAEKVPLLLADLTEIAEAATGALSEDRWAIYRKAAASELSRTKAVLEGLARGQIEVPSGDNDALRSMVDAAERRILAATVFPGQGSFWNSERGKAYLEMNRTLTRRPSPVTITRVFIVDEKKTRTEELERDLETILVEQCRAGVHVWKVDAARLDSEHYAPVVVIDDAIVQEMVANARGDAVRYRYSTNPADVERARSRIRVILGSEAITKVCPDARSSSE
jgi:hypothetical protein